MATVQQIKDAINNANTLGRTNLAEKGVTVDDTATTYQIMQKISELTDAFIITVTGHQLDNSCTVDKTYVEISLAYQAGKSIIMVDPIVQSVTGLPVILTPYLLENGEGTFITITRENFSGPYKDYQYCITVSPDNTATYSWEELLDGGNMLVVNATLASGGVATLDKTYTEITQSLSAEKIVIIKHPLFGTFTPIKLLADNSVRFETTWYEDNVTSIVGIVVHPDNTANWDFQSGGGITYTNIVYNEDNTVTLTDKDGIVHTMSCTYEDGKLTGVNYDGKAVELTYNGDTLVNVGKTAVDMSNAPATSGGTPQGIAKASVQRLDESLKTTATIVKN